MIFKVENKVNAPPKDFDENEISDAEFLRQTGLEICIGSLNAFKRKLKINLMSMLKKKDLVIKWINFLIKDEKCTFYKRMSAIRLCVNVRQELPQTLYFFLLSFSLTVNIRLDKI